MCSICDTIRALRCSIYCLCSSARESRHRHANASMCGVTFSSVWSPWCILSSWSMSILFKCEWKLGRLQRDLLASSKYRAPQSRPLGRPGSEFSVHFPHETFQKVFILRRLCSGQSQLGSWQIRTGNNVLGRSNILKEEKQTTSVVACCFFLLSNHLIGPKCVYCHDLSWPDLAFSAV